ncbi:Uncharacterised protein [Campylobacter sputorum subsp. bubulus]|uniref:Uncharacterized protein n=1 Tax=Campylobacter sputorum subsp. sputorum TaxID=32024 RepID=A0A381DL79_9BACT|nr:hypothetical protein [Campylobacter sputorum]ASM34711.1 hypothetical protein CSPUT_0460 [Campylobacter sputorum aubsp. sputorum RM3237]ASM36372.1 hypothetical protein CSF_0466 [Campylobacter sputorum bv. faecalis CCUG 20703]ASM38060.1 hypothetical protein CSPARA_0464 [Campylobacter sputorum bv. paraureolyticus LMG 11764]KAB0581727.1 hypothetical protein F7P64_05580 [Campylobacter sputorum subsp. sputorum]MDY6121204.1 hypothetical protein [Campylobacter sputorum]
MTQEEKLDSIEKSLNELKELSKKKDAQIEELIKQRNKLRQNKEAYIAKTYVYGILILIALGLIIYILYEIMNKVNFGICDV